MRQLSYLQAALFILLPTFVIAQTAIDKETSFLYFLKVNNTDFNEGSYPFGNGNMSCFWYYSSEFDKSNYDIIKNDEFKRNNYTNQLTKTLRTKIDVLSFKKEYSLMSQSSFGEFNFSDNSFPITNIFSDCYFLKDRTMFDHDCQFKTVPISIGWIINREYFDYVIKIPPEKAEKLINARKQTNGRINRTLQTKIIFTFVNQPYYIQTRQFGGSIYNVLEKDGFIIYITRIEFYDNGQLIASLKPNTSFEDPISGYKKINGEDIYHMVTKDYQKTLSDNTIVVNRVNGVPAGPVKYYNENGNLIKIADCSYFFPNKIIYAGDEVKFLEISGKNIPYSIMQYSHNRIAGYEIHFEIRGNNVQLNTVHKIDESGTKTLLTDPNGWFSHYGGEVKAMPVSVQELIKKYDYDNYFSYSINAATIPPKIIKDEEVQVSDIDKVPTIDLDKKTSFAYVMKAYNYEYKNDEFLYYYLEMFDNNFSNYSENEIELKRKKENALLEINKLIDNVKYETIYYRNEIAFLGNYDFNNGRFEFEPFGQIFSNQLEYPYFYIFNFPSRGLKTESSTSNVSQILLKNYKDFDGLKISSIDAENLLKQLPNNRQVYLRFYYSMLPEKFQIIDNITYDYGVFCHINLIEVWADSNMSTNKIAVLKAKE
jgi:hypothetical protein